MTDRSSLLLAKGPTRPARVVLLGAGKMAREHATALRGLGELAHGVGVADPSPEALAAMEPLVPGAVMTADANELLALVDSDAAHICTPPDRHCMDAVGSSVRSSGYR
jgi:predicted dehydrogenase